MADSVAAAVASVDATGMGEATLDTEVSGCCELGVERVERREEGKGVKVKDGKDGKGGLTP